MIEVITWYLVASAVFTAACCLLFTWQKRNDGKEVN